MRPIRPELIRLGLVVVTIDGNRKCLPADPPPSYDQDVKRTELR